MFLAAGTADTTVLPRNTINLADAIRRDGGRVEERLYPGIGHKLILGAFSGLLRWRVPALDDVTGFLHRVAGRQGSRSSWVGLSGQRFAAGAVTDGPDRPGRDVEQTTRDLPHPAMIPSGTKP